MAQIQKIRDNSDDIGLAIGLVMACSAFYIAYSQPLNPWDKNSRSIIEHVASVIPGTDTYEKDHQTTLELK